MGKSSSINPNPCFQHSTQIPLCIHFWKWRWKNWGTSNNCRTMRPLSIISNMGVRSRAKRNADGALEFVKRHKKGKEQCK